MPPPLEDLMEPDAWFDEPTTPDAARGQYLCEVCEMAQTDDVLPASESPSGLDLAICAPCRLRLRPTL